MSLTKSTVLANASRSVIIGTAGHIDHGKTALIRALTGVDADRLPEEKRRGITIDLGFASFETPASDGSTLCLSFIDVPGHARFVRNMLAGTGGIDAVILVISAEEGIKPQTEEHLAICELLGIAHGIVVLTKTDVTPAERVHALAGEVQKYLSNSFLSAAPLLSVSAHAGTGISDLRRKLIRMAETLPPRDVDAFARLPIDRAFIVRGFGTVVTGTLIGGRLDVGDSLTIQPGGRQVKIRGIQSHNRIEEHARAGSRTALNLSRVEASQIERGDTLVAEPKLKAVDCVDVELTVLANAPPLKHRARAHFHAFSSECMATITLYDVAIIEAGETKLARLRLTRPVVLLSGDRFVLRSGSPMTTIGGGCVLDTHPAMQVRKVKTAEWLRALHSASREEAVWLRIARMGTTGIHLIQLRIETGLGEAAIKSLTQRWIGEGRLHRLSDDWLLTQESLSEVGNAILVELSRAGENERGVKRAELRERVQCKPDVFDFAILRLEQERTVRIHGDVVNQVNTSARNPGERHTSEMVRQEFERAGLAPPSPTEVGARLDIPPGRMRELMTELLREKVLVRLGSDSLCAHRRSLEALADRMQTMRGREIDVATFKQLAGVSRKYAIPLLEYLDRERITLKLGDKRRIL